ncbi:MAG: ribokinase, partial [Candidatus Yonathbacteria bacterium]|nr:ribokinase [Candidatus Yonathbacteria bacterium]
MTSKVCVLGSINMDVVVRVDRFPTVGETITGLSCDLMPGGKGANQAVAIANMGVPVDLIGALGGDEFGKLLRSHLIDAGVNIDAVVQTKSSSGTAIVAVDDEGKNQIIVIPGSNLLLQRKMIERYLERQGSVVRYLVSQFEVPLDLICYAFGKMKSWGAITVLNPSPMRSIPDKLIEYTDIFVLNELELAQAVDMVETISSPDKIAQAVLKWARRIGNKIVVVTLGKNGLIAIQDGQVIKQPAQKVSRVVDTTGAGDCFCGSLVAFLHKGYSLHESMALAQKAAAYSVQRNGASPS